MFNLDLRVLHLSDGRRIIPIEELRRAGIWIGPEVEEPAAP